MPDPIPQEVYDKFENFASTIKEAGYKRYSSDAILHRIRWHMKIEQGNREFKCNDHWTSHLARWYLDRHPDNPTFFELRERQYRDTRGQSQSEG